MTSVRCKMGLHTWNDSCTCECGAKRDAGHQWNNCTCTTCGAVRNNHTWDHCTCTTCGKVRDKHNFVDCVCTVCGKENHFWKVLDISTEYRPGKTRSGEIKDMVFTTTLSKCDRCGNLKTEKTKSEAVPVY